MTIEMINKRIAGKEKEIEKLTKKLARIEKAKQSNYNDNNPYYYSEYDYEECIGDISRTNKTLQKYKDSLKEETDKANNRNIPAIVEFLDDWETKMIAFLIEKKKDYDLALAEQSRLNHEYVEQMYDGTLSKMTKEEKDNFHFVAKVRSREFQERWNYITQYNHGSRTWKETMIRDIGIEKNRKYDFIVERTVNLVGKIIDATNLHIGKNGDLNGIIIGNEGEVKVQTIDAGGYNIQCYHFRVLINKIH